MNKEERELYSQEITDFRYGVIADLLNSHLGWGELARIIKEKAKMKRTIPYSTRTTVTTGCIRNWLYLYRKYGKDGLAPKLRKDAGVSKALSSHESSLILAALEKKPYLTASSVVKLLQQEGKIVSQVSKSALSRLVIASGLTKTERLKFKDREQNLKFDFFYPLDCVQADDLHAFPVLDEKNNKRKAILMAFIDDATRRIVYAEFSFSERSLAFEIGIKHILKAHGRIGQLYVDNGSPFVSKQTKRILDILRIRICHSRPGIPKGRGKIERFFRTVRDQFLRPLDETSIRSIEDLNIRFHTWLESEYHRNPHRGIGKRTPIEAWLDATQYITVMDPAVDIDRVFYHTDYRKVYRDSTFTLGGVLYEAPSILGGEKIKLSFDPVPQRRRVFIECDGKEYGEALPVDSFANAHVIRNKTNHRFAIDSGIPESNNNEPAVKSNIQISLDAASSGDRE
jgi:putative transposase